MGDAAPGDPEPETLPNGNMLRRFERPDKNQGKPLHLSYWLLGNLVPPKTIRLALFGFAVLEAEAASETHQQKVAMLDHQIRGTVLTSLTPEEIQARVAGQEKRTWWRFW
ncbi:MAG TPA: hypothetical protein VGX70_16345 [Gemmataceae bacterium]|nr:hypothetical protein [Gemmataceae bacterium]